MLSITFPSKPSDRSDFVVFVLTRPVLTKSLKKGAWFIRNRVPFIASHPDFNCPLEDKDMILGCGSLSAAFTVATGVKPKKFNLQVNCDQKNASNELMTAHPCTR
jgi:ribonucleotide monophosphatase NagD (HAD superfamily)